MERETQIFDLLQKSKIGMPEGHRVTQVVQHVHEVASNTQMTAKRLLVQRGDGDFCAMYQQLYGTFEVAVRPAWIITFDGKPVLKTLDANGMHTWNEEYWTFDLDGPIYLDLDRVRSKWMRPLLKAIML